MRYAPAAVPQNEYDFSQFLGTELQRLADAGRFFFEDGEDGLVIKHDDGSKGFASLFGGSAKLFHAGIEKLSTQSYGALVAGRLRVDQDSDAGLYLSRGSADWNLYIENSDDTLRIYDYTSATDRIIVGTQEFRFRGAAANPYFSLYTSANARAMFMQADVSAHYIATEVHGNPLVLQGENVSGTPRNLAQFDPDSYAQFCYAGNLALWTFSEGAIIQHPTSTSPTLYFYRSDGTRNAFIASYSSTLYLRNENHGSEIQIQAENAGGTVRDIIRANPDTYTDIYAAGYLGIRVGNNQLGFFNNSGNAKQTVTGSRGGNAALANLLSVLVNHGLLTDSTT